MAEKSETLVTKEERINEAKELFGRGSRNYCMKQFSDAADDLSACCSIYSELYGPNSSECGLPYLMYAKSLIAIGKDENHLIVPGDDEEEADDDDDADDEVGEEEEADGEEKEQDEDDEEKADDAEQMDTKESEKDTSNKSADAETKNSEKASETSSEKDSSNQKDEVAAGGSSSSGTKDLNGEPQPGPSTTNGDTSVQEEISDNLQVAWEILELAVHIFQQQGEKGFENLPECYIELAGISFENSFFKEAINDYGKALEIYKKTTQPDLRLLAEVHYKVGLCYMMEREFEESVKSFKGAIAELDKVIEMEKARATDEAKEIVEDIEQLKKDILEKIIDVEEAMKTPLEDVKRELSKIIVSGGGESSGLNNGAGSSSSGAATNGSSSKPSSAMAKPATDISHLIKRKKPDSASTEVEGSPAKRTASDTESANTSA